MFGYQPTIFMPRPGSKDIYKRLQKQCENMKIPIIPPSNHVEELHKALQHSDVILDAIFGFSFKPPVRVPFDEILPILKETRLPIVSVDIPSGWDVENGNVLGIGFHPNVLISLTAPKEGVKDFRGKHFLGGRFVPKSLEKKFQLNLPAYHGYDQIVELSSEESPQDSRY
jgi:NAD(P)H-hydrate epimerase